MENYILAIETGGTKIQLALGKSDGTIVFSYRLKVKPELGHIGILDAVLDSFSELNKKAADLGGHIQKIGLGFGGPVDSKNGIVIGSVQISGWKEFPIKSYLEERLSIPVYVYNDTNAATWGEYKKGAGQGTNVFFYTNIGSGIGGGVVINGSLYDGQGYGAAEFGQTYLYDCNSQERYPVKQLENICSGWAIEEHLRSAVIPKSSMLWQLCNNRQSDLTCAMLGEAFKKKDKFAFETLNDVAHLFSIALSNVISLYSPECIAIGGGVSLIGEPLIKLIREYTARYVFMSSVGKYKIEKSILGDEIVLVGVSLLAGEQNN